MDTIIVTQERPTKQAAALVEGNLEAQVAIAASANFVRAFTFMLDEVFTSLEPRGTAGARGA